MSEPHLTLPGPRDSLETWLRSTHCLLALLGDAQDIFHLCWPKARQGHPGSPQPSVQEESRLEEPVTPKMKTTCWAWLSLKPQAHSSLCLFCSPATPFQGVGCGETETRGHQPESSRDECGFLMATKPSASFFIKAEGLSRFAMGDAPAGALAGACGWSIGGE